MAHRALASDNEEAVAKTIETGLATFWSRSRERLWVKGEESGLRGVYVDCDGDALLYDVCAPEKSCHTGSFSCFGEPSVGEYR